MEQIGYINNSLKLDAVFAALADPTRRSILMRLTQGEASVFELAEPFKMSQPAISKHIKKLEKAGLVERAIDKQKRPARLNAEAMVLAVEWLDNFRQFWSTSFDQLDDLLLDLQKLETEDLKDD